MLDNLVQVAPTELSDYATYNLCVTLQGQEFSSSEEHAVTMQVSPEQKTKLQHTSFEFNKHCTKRELPFEVLKKLITPTSLRSTSRAYTCVQQL
jgi:hypothetical protein